MNILMFAASVRIGSCNKKLIRIASEFTQEKVKSVSLIDYADILPSLYDPNDEVNIGIPEKAKQFSELLKQHDGLIISSPEYNFSTPCTLKNLIDWVSRIKPVPWKNVPILLMSASQALVGGNRGLWATRIPLECCGAMVHPEMFSLAMAYDAFDEQDKLKDKALHHRLRETVFSFVDYVEKLKN